MDRYKLSKAGVNTREGIARFGGNQAAYESVLYAFPQEPYFRRLCQEIRRRDAAAAFAAAHALKGEVGNLSMNRLYEDLLPLVDAVRRGSLENADAMLERIEKDYREILAALS